MILMALEMATDSLASALELGSGLRHTLIVNNGRNPQNKQVNKINKIFYY